MGKKGKWLVISMIGLAGVVVAGGLLVYLRVTAKPTEIARQAETRQYIWNKVDLGTQVMSGDGSEYHLLTQKGQSRNWMIFFSGGGASWDAASAAQPIKVMNVLRGRDAGNYFANIPVYLLALLNGITVTDHPENPFKDWNVVYIPYSTGDFHTGNRSASYLKEDGSPFIMHYKGRSNVQHSLEWIYANVDQPEKLLIAGESAGGFGSAFWAGEIAGHYEDAEIYQYSDSSFLYSGKWPDIVDQEWNADFEQTFGYPAAADLIGAAFEGNRRKLPANVVLLQSYSLYDEVLISFQNKINDYKGLLDRQRIEAWSRQLRDSVFKLSTLPNYYYYLTDSGLNGKTGMTGHTFATRQVFYQTEQDGVRLVTWLDDVINQRKRYSVGSRYLDEQADRR
ncbi:pectinacetylesterase family protein [Paenibacillus albidus]|uniref:pectinacetylesterase family protein n=1 Tax=Paenibacillus albidus TaxID=2041023 RepID=UPI002034BE01|nr:pectinacetylesterase family protein [Paenibacillus albidus]